MLEGGGVIGTPGWDKLISRVNAFIFPKKLKHSTKHGNASTLKKFVTTLKHHA